MTINQSVIKMIYDLDLTDVVDDLLDHLADNAGSLQKRYWGV